MRSSNSTMIQTLSGERIEHPPNTEASVRTMPLKRFYHMDIVIPTIHTESIILIYGLPILFDMAKKNDGGFQSQAGLVRYFDTENDKALKLSPKLVIGLAVGFAVLIILLDVFMPMN